MSLINAHALAIVLVSYCSYVPSGWGSYLCPVGAIVVGGPGGEVTTSSPGRLLFVAIAAAKMCSPERWGHGLGAAGVWGPLLSTFFLQ